MRIQHSSVDLKKFQHYRVEKKYLLDRSQSTLSDSSSSVPITQWKFSIQPNNYIFYRRTKNNDKINIDINIMIGILVKVTNNVLNRTN